MSVNNDSGCGGEEMEEGGGGSKKRHLRGDTASSHLCEVVHITVAHGSPGHGSGCAWSYNSAAT